jgi:hypothetical protein
MHNPEGILEVEESLNIPILRAGALKMKMSFRCEIEFQEAHTWEFNI